MLSEYSRKYGATSDLDRSNKMSIAGPAHALRSIFPVFVSRLHPARKIAVHHNRTSWWADRLDENLILAIDD